jgi:hypothetical protein
MKYLKATPDLIETLRSWSNQFNKEAELSRTKSWRSLQAQGKWLDWPTVLQAVKAQKEEFEAADGRVSMAWEAVKYAVLLLYTNLPPGRSLEYASMRYQFATELGADLYGFEPDVKNSNWCIISRDNQKALLYIGLHKTSQKIGVQKIELSSQNPTCTLLNHLVEYICKHRPILVTNKTHQYLFVVSYITDHAVIILCMHYLI